MPEPQQSPAIQPAAQPAASEPSGAQQDQPKYVTEEMLAEAIERGFRRAQQSAADRTRTIESKVKELSDQFQKVGVQITPEIHANMQRQAEQEVDAQPAPQAQQQAPAEQPSEGNPVFDWTQAYYAESGVAIASSDPEWVAVKAALDDPKGSMVKYQIAVQKAVELKRARVTTTTETANARVVGAGGQPGTAPATSAKQLWERAHNK